MISKTSSLGQIAKEIGSVSEHLSSAPEIAKQQVAELIAAAPESILTAVDYGGWKGREAYIGPGCAAGAAGTATSGLAPLPQALF